MRLVLQLFRVLALFLVSFLSISSLPVRASLIEEIRRTYIPGVVIRGMVEHRVQHSHSCKVSTLTLAGIDPISRNPRNVYVSYYETLVGSRRPASMIIVPPLRGVNILDRGNAKSFCKRGLYTYLIETWDFASDPGLSWDLEDRNTIRAISAIRNVVEFLNYRSSSPIGILGTSQGAIFASFVLAVDPRVNVGALIDGGAPTCTILARSQNVEALKLKRARMKLYGVTTEEEYERILSQSIRINGLALARESDAKTLLMFIATKDTRVPLQTQLKLWNAWKRPESVLIPFDHIPSIISTSLFYHKVLIGFFMRHLG